MSNRDYVYQHLPVEEQDRGANDEGYYYEYCPSCQRRTEYEDDFCCECNHSDYD